MLAISSRVGWRYAYFLKGISAVIACKNPDIKVTVVDLNQTRINSWKSDQLPIFEPGLREVVQFARDNECAGRQSRLPNLFFSTNIDCAIASADLIFIAVNTPTKSVGQGAGSASDLAYVEAAARRIAEVSTSDKIVVEKSTVPCGTAQTLRHIFASVAQAPGVNFEILSNPEFLAEGTAIRDLLSPDRILIGSNRDWRALQAADRLADVYAAWVPRERILTVNCWSSELSKLAANCMLAQRISSINSLSAICEVTGADIDEVAHAVGQDTRIGSKMLKASAGFGGSCFKKDILGLVYIAESHNLHEVASYWRRIVDINEYSKARFAKRITQCLYNTLDHKRIAILGWAYKKDTGDTRESAAINVAGQLIAENAHVAVYDPEVRPEQIMSDLTQHHSPEALAERVSIHKDPFSACVGASAVVILTEWDEFKTDRLPSTVTDILTKEILDAPLASTPRRTSEDSRGSSERSWAAEDGSSDESGGEQSVKSPVSEVEMTPQQDGKAGIDWPRIASCMRRPRLLFDGRNVVEPAKLMALGFQVHCIGKSGSALNV
ncbi:hypothetical protein LTR78_006243 [Recurvomyces mirabilis]|uniref:UDP-glucose 6-dehydrogenase n=1 Tax=Recurvomyces mirabilis TaxID=574656 RepID=A0AAE0WLR6_9PEZI|nr:hypothetical protein LTR78_006243 [Recurvomyces mirabilis]KAK5152084.1 hypothetical protein LTS14_008859 [Recurvomyces mirabilis]